MAKAAAATIPATWADFLKLILSDVAKGPLLLADALAVKADVEKLLVDAGLPIPWANAVVAHDAATLQLEQAVTDRKLGDGTILKGLGQFLNSPVGQLLLQLLLGKLGAGGTPAA